MQIWANEIAYINIHDVCDLQQATLLQPISNYRTIVGYQ